MTAASWSVWDVKKPARKKGFGRGFWVTLAVGAVLLGGPAISHEVVTAASGFLTGSYDQRSQQVAQATQELAATSNERGAEAGDRFVENANGILTGFSNFVESFRLSLAEEVR
jgi:hypothetical protein